MTFWRSSKRKISAVAVAAFFCAAALGGCSVLRIDVDVYKGPLANHQDVQVEQLVAMAVGAQPLLIQLRDSIEWASVCDIGDNGEAFDNCIEAHRKFSEAEKCYSYGAFYECYYFAPDEEPHCQQRQLRSEYSNLLPDEVQI